MNDILKDIVDQKKIEVARLDSASLRHAAEQSPAPREFLSVRKSEQTVYHPALIAELKRASPSKGILAQNLDLYQVAEIYSKNGASAISVITDERFFLGNLETLRELRFTRCMHLPLLRKDFIIDETQLFQSRANGADAVLLIAAVLTDDAILAALHACSLDLGLTPLVEVHTESEIERVLRVNGIRLIGINNRNLSTFAVSLETTQRLRPLIPETITVIAESGITSAFDVDRLANSKIDAILVGETLIKSADMAAKVRELSGFKVPDDKN